MKELQELREDILLLKNIGTISKEVELVMLRKLNIIEKQLTIPVVMPELFCGRDIKTCVFYDSGKCKHDEFECRDQVTK